MGTASAQQAQVSPTDILDHLQRLQVNGGSDGLRDGRLGSDPTLGGRQGTRGEMTATRQPTQPSSIELDYAKRIGKAVRQYGYDVFGADPGAAAVMGAIGDDYILGVGDEVVVTFRGQRNASVRARVDREGRVIIPELAPIAAGGRPLGAFRDELEAQAHATFLQTELFVSVGSVREISVLVAGEVTRPGLQRLSALSSVVDVLALAGGPKKTGSLRSVKLSRGNKVLNVDLYDLLLGQKGQADFRLQEGDRLTVPTLGPTVAVVGEVLRPGVYEIGRAGVTRQAALSLAGGALRGEGYRFLRYSTDARGQDRVDEVAANAKLSPGDILMVSRTTEARTKTVMVDGHVSVPGIRSTGTTPTLAAVLADPQILKDDAYLLFAVVQTTDPTTRVRSLRAVDPSRILGGKGDYALGDQDTVIFLGMDDVRYLSSADVQAVFSGRKPYFGRTAPDKAEQRTDELWPAETPTLPGAEIGEGQSLRSGSSSRNPGAALPGATVPGAANAASAAPRAGEPLNREAEVALSSCQGLRVLASLVATGNVTRFASGQFGGNAAGPNQGIANVQPCPRIYDRYPDLLPFVLDHVTNLEGEVRNPGSFPTLPDTVLPTLLGAAGGPTRQADTSQIEVSYYGHNQAASVRQTVSLAVGTQVRVGPGDSIRVAPTFNQAEQGVVLLQGEVRRPGSYSIRRGERMSELLQRAGGLTDQAYTVGTVFARESVRREEARLYEVTAREIEMALARQAVSSPEAIKEMAALKSMLGNIRQTQPVGRVVAEADPTTLQLRPELDSILEPGDRIFVPKRPNHILVTGEVLHAGAQQFKAGTPAAEYIEMAGGLRESADSSRIFVILPSGQAQSLSTSFWNYRDEFLPPGSTIVVPMDASPFSFWTAIKDLTQVMGQVAISAASLVVISR